ncbi:MurR/RpiR family transcriptional regulator [Virgibacillus xinjiangensis]|uniref:MurR/RpiR family transcriptional regulator n=1 Tax=Virgibacillus xinjiangensis TaxID=393090 RepID=A0ABV7CYS4_9BACI
MSTSKGGLVILKEMLNSLPPSEKKIALYILENPEESIHLTALALGERSQTSSAAVIRLCKSLGLKGFQELKIRVAGDLREDSIEEYRDIEPDENVRDIISKVTANTVQTLNETADMISVEQLEQAVNILSKAKSFTFFGFGASYIAAMDAEQKFMRLNKNVQSFSDVHMAATAIANKGPEDAVIGISFSGNTPEAVKLMQLAKKQEAATIGITKYGKSQIAAYTDIVLYTSAAKEATFRTGATSSRIAQLHMIDLLLMCLSSADYKHTVDHLDQTREAISFLHDRQ